MLVTFSIRKQVVDILNSIRMHACTYFYAVCIRAMHALIFTLFVYVQCMHLFLRCLYTCNACTYYYAVCIRAHEHCFTCVGYNIEDL